MFTEDVVKSSEFNEYIYNVYWAGVVVWQYPAKTQEMAWERGRQWFAATLMSKLQKGF